MNMKKIVLCTGFIFLILSPGLFAQKSFWDSPNAYLKQTPPGDTPVVFAKGMLADTGYWVGSRVAFTNDGRQFIYGTNTNWFDGKHQKLKYFRFDGKSWKGPLLMFAGFGSPTFSTDGSRLYITGRDGAIYKSWFSDTGWVKPTGFFHRSYSLYNFMPTLSGHYYVGSNGTWGNRQDFNSWKFSLLAGIGSDTSIHNLGAPLNSQGFNGDFYVAPDESYMIISARESPSFQSELYISFRKPNHDWGEPVSLGPLINDGLAHRWGAYVTPDKKYLFYTKGTSEKDCTIYWVRFDRLLKKLQPKS
jgi:hypothetical protein